MIVKRMGQRLMGTRKGEPSTPLCDRALARARVLSARQLPTDHVHVGGPRARSTNIRMINRRPSLLDRCPIRFTSAAALPTGEQTQCQTWGRAAQPASSMGSLSGRPLAMRLWTKPTKRWPKRIKKRAAVISAKLDRSLHIRGGPPTSFEAVGGSSGCARAHTRADMPRERDESCEKMITRPEQSCRTPGRIGPRG